MDIFASDLYEPSVRQKEPRPEVSNPSEREDQPPNPEAFVVTEIDEEEDQEPDPEN